jgi:predicted ArsR family transcriptional regulator
MTTETIKMYRVPGKPKCMTAEELAMDLDIHVDRIVKALENLKKKGLVEEVE